jgi:hypothetical protein
MPHQEPRRTRRALWAAHNTFRGEFTHKDVDGFSEWTRGSRTPWSAKVPSPLQAHLLATRGLGGHQRLLEVSLGLNRAQRRALHSKKGSARMVEHRRPTSTPAQSFLPGKGSWNRHAVRMEAFRRLQGRVAEHKRRNVWWRALGRLLRLVFWVAPVVLVRRMGRRIAARFAPRSSR